MASFPGAEEADALLNELPTTDGDELVTKQFLRAELADVRREISGLQVEVHSLLRRQTMWVFGAIVSAMAA